MSESWAGESIDIIEPWIWKTISEDPQLLELVGGIDHISGTLSNEELPLPYVTMLYQSSRDITTNQGHVIAIEALYMVKSVDATGSWDDLTPIASRVSELLYHPGETITVENGSLTCTRERIIQYPEKLEGVQYRHLGAIWRIRASRDN